mmetsp:Transcript_14938/g.10843  ORF Transcript_14938/g.10843 Transcript_14938/m.10843 type:complete len:125 (+) Transcript_14938:228-602(+)|eukprot:CAMPEP_0202979704 /NCGR_PEP_ID=MMETSP1396-20130829/85787_1 /ASSEMBLY_ACC=CAM_ASM_000872 /TAXON_ID= /ORGANISM="Pseudokeronopsis sp., Strain Brazil" /LENGTH=124 /DNA_ID=CAMNT_0049719259 /DNA_START=755 /DNA_END=1129 /DNA_ORIENTATION=+
MTKWLGGWMAIAIVLVGIGVNILTIVYIKVIELRAFIRNCRHRCLKKRNAKYMIQENGPTDPNADLSSIFQTIHGLNLPQDDKDFYQDKDLENCKDLGNAMELKPKKKALKKSKKPKKAAIEEG